LTSSPPLKDGDSFCKTAMSRREDMVSCIDVTIMDRFAHRALPSSDSKIFPAFWAGAAVTHAARLGGKRFIDFCEPHACVSAFILQHGSKCTPARIEHRLSHSGLSKSGGIDVTDEDRTVGIDQPSAEFMQEIFSPIRDLGMNRPGAVSMAGTLRGGQCRFQVAIKALSFDRLQSLITERGKGLQPEIDAHARHRAIEDRCDRQLTSFICCSLSYTDIQIPASTAVFTEIARSKFKFTETVAVPQRQPTPREVDLSAAIANGSDFKGNPTERPACTAALAPGESDFSKLAAPARVLFRDLLNRLDRKLQRAVTARGLRKDQKSNPDKNRLSRSNTFTDRSLQ
jgi:hypothetical protein